MLQKDVFNYIKDLNPGKTIVSSIGSFISDSDKMVSSYIYEEIINYLPVSSLAFKILKSNQTVYTTKQLWVIAFELYKSSDFILKLEREKKEFENNENQKKEFKTAKNKIKAEEKKALKTQKFDRMKNCLSIGVGERVSHAAFGDGVVVFSSKEKITVLFDDCGEKSLLPQWAKLKKINK